MARHPPVPSGTIDFAMNDELGNKGKVLARVNVYVVAGEAPQTWFRVASAPSTIRQNSLVLDHRLLNGNSSRQDFFVMHQGADQTVESSLGGDL